MTDSTVLAHVDLGPITDARQLLAGDLLGMDARRKAQLDEYDQLRDGIVEIEIPSYVISVNSSFLRGFIRPSIQALGEAGFRARYVFIGPDFSEDIEDEIRRTVLRMQRDQAMSLVA